MSRCREVSRCRVDTLTPLTPTERCIAVERCREGCRGCRGVDLTLGVERCRGVESCREVSRVGVEVSSRGSDALEPPLSGGRISGRKEQLSAHNPRFQLLGFRPEICTVHDWRQTHASIARLPCGSQGIWTCQAGAHPQNWKRVCVSAYVPVRE